MNTNPFTHWLYHNIYIAGYETTPHFIIILVMAGVLLVSCVPLLLMLSRWLSHRRQLAHIAHPTDISNDAVCQRMHYGYGGYYGTEYALHSIKHGVETCLHISGWIFKITLITALVLIFIHLSFNLSMRVSDIYTYQSLNPPVHRQLPKDFVEYQNGVRDTVENPKKGAKEHKDWIKELLLEWFI